MVPVFFVTGTNYTVPREIQATFEFAAPDLADKRNGMMVWRLRLREESALDEE